MPPDISQDRSVVSASAKIRTFDGEIWNPSSSILQFRQWASKFYASGDSVAEGRKPR